MLSNLFLTLPHSSFSIAFNLIFDDTFLKSSYLPRLVGLKTAKGIESLFLVKSIISIFLL